MAQGILEVVAWQRKGAKYSLGARLARAEGKLSDAVQLQAKAYEAYEFARFWFDEAIWFEDARRVQYRVVRDGQW